MIVRKNSKSSHAIYCWVLQIVIILALVSVVVWRSLVPKCADYTITNVYIPAFEGHNSTIDHQIEAIRNASIFLNLKISNPNNRFGICYEEINVTLRRNNVVIGAKSIPAFYQDDKKSAVCELLMNGKGHSWGGVGGGNWTTELRVHLESIVRYKILRLKTKHYRVNLEAYMGIGSNGRILGAKDIKLHSKFEQTKTED